MLDFGQKLSTVPLGEIGCLGLFGGWFWLVGWGDVAVYVFYPLGAEKCVYYAMQFKIFVFLLHVKILQSQDQFLLFAVVTAD